MCQLYSIAQITNNLLVGTLPLHYKKQKKIEIVHSFYFKTDDAPFVYESGLLLRFVMLCRFEINRYVTVPTLLLFAFVNL